MTSTTTLNKNATSFEYHQVVRTIDHIQLQFNFERKPAAVVLGSIICGE